MKNNRVVKKVHISFAGRKALYSGDLFPFSSFAVYFFGCVNVSLFQPRGKKCK